MGHHPSPNLTRLIAVMAAHRAALEHTDPRSPYSQREVTRIYSYLQECRAAGPDRGRTQTACQHAGDRILDERSDQSGSPDAASGSRAVKQHA